MIPKMFHELKPGEYVLAYDLALSEAFIGEINSSGTFSKIKGITDSSCTICGSKKLFVRYFKLTEEEIVFHICLSQI